MAKNLKYKNGRQLTVTVPANTKSGDPVAYGKRPGVALTDEVNGKAVVDFDGVYALSAKAIDANSNSAIAEGDELYFVLADTPKISKKATGVFYGFAHGAVTAGATATINVKVGR